MENKKDYCGVTVWFRGESDAAGVLYGVTGAMSPVLLASNASIAYPITNNKNATPSPPPIRI